MTVTKDNIPIGFSLSISVTALVLVKGVVGTEYVYPLSSRFPPRNSFLPTKSNLKRQILSKVRYKFLMSERQQISLLISVTPSVPANGVVGMEYNKL